MRELVEAGASQNELRQTLNRLDSFSQSSVPSPLAPAPTSTQYLHLRRIMDHPIRNCIPLRRTRIRVFRQVSRQQPKTEQVNITSLLLSS